VTAAREADATSPVILCYDGSKEAADAIAYAGELLRGRPAIVVTAWRPVIEEALSTGMTRPTADPSEVNKREQESAAQTAARGARLASQAGFEARPLAVRADGPLWVAIELAAEDANANLIVCTTRRSGVTAALPGNLARALVNHASCPVLVVPSVKAAAERAREVEEWRTSRRARRKEVAAGGAARGKRAVSAADPPLRRAA
jgi:nucleotide-binding universal stress UspA family protein